MFHFFNLHKIILCFLRPKFAISFNAIEGNVYYMKVISLNKSILSIIARRQI